MKICFIFTRITHGNGPLQRALRLASLGHEIDILVLSQDLVDASDYLEQKYHKLNNLNLRSLNLKEPRISFSSILSLRLLLVQHEYDIAQSTTIWNSVFTSLCLIGLRKIHHVTFDGGLLDRYSIKVRIARLLAHFCASGSIYISSACYQSQSSIEKTICSSKSRVIYNGVDLNLLNKVESKPCLSGFFTIGSVADFKPEKNHIMLSKYIEYLCKFFPSINFRLILAGKNVKDACELFNHINQNFKLEILPYMPRSTLFSYMKTFDLFVSTSYTEGLPESVVQAIGLSLPLILSDIPAHRELIPYASSAFVLDFYDSDQIFSSTSYITKINSKNKLPSLKSSFLNTFSITEIAYQYLQFYKDILIR